MVATLLYFLRISALVLAVGNVADRRFGLSYLLSLGQGRFFAATTAVCILIWVTNFSCFAAGYLRCKGTHGLRPGSRDERE
jgi:hypothetical protein